MSWARNGLKGSAVLLVCFCIWVSASLNWNFGFSLGTSEFEAWTYALASLLSDLLKIMLPFFLFWLMRKGREIWSLKDWSFSNAIIFFLILLFLFQFLMLWFVTIAYSLSAFWGFSAVEPALTLDNRPKIPVVVSVMISLAVETVASLGLFALFAHKGAGFYGTVRTRKTM